jgi:hypothetical protein
MVSGALKTTVVSVTDSLASRAEIGSRFITESSSALYFVLGRTNGIGRGRLKLRSA